MNNKTVFVGLSGGVDSSVSAWRLLQQGYKVVGVFIKVWHPEFLPCNWENERRDAMRVAAYLNIPFLTCDAESAYRDSVAKYFISEYQAGRTPNPDVMCNQYVKFGAFIDFAKQHGADYIATGHYVQRVSSDSAFELHRGHDTNKDQSYFLWTITQEQLEYSLFPVGDSDKAVIRAEAGKVGLPVAQKSDSQGICFLGHVDIYSFLSEYITLVEGVVYDEVGNSIGTHRGAQIYTPGQRHGFAINAKESAGPYYVQSTNVETNSIVVSKEPPQVKSDTNLILTNVSFINKPLTPLQTVQIQIRYRQKPVQANVIDVDIEANKIALLPDTDIGAWAAGQSCVLYDSMQCLGGGIIDNACQ